MPIRDDRRRKASTAIAVRSLQALLVLAAVFIANSSQTVPAEGRPSVPRRAAHGRRSSSERHR
jgi:hypothetical protein